MKAISILRCYQQPGRFILCYHTLSTHTGVSSHSFKKHTYLFVSSHLNLSHNLSANSKVSGRWRNIGNWPVLACLEKQSRNSCWKMYTTVDLLFSSYCRLWVKNRKWHKWSIYSWLSGTCIPLMLSRERWFITGLSGWHLPSQRFHWYRPQTPPEGCTVTSVVPQWIIMCMCVCNVFHLTTAAAVSVLSQFFH